VRVGAQVLLLNRTRLPPEALFILRHQKFGAAGRGAYRELLSPADRALLPWLPRFRELSRYRRRPAPPGGHLGSAAFREYYGGLIAKYIPGGALRF
jgi:inositol oxygenase